MTHEELTKHLNKHFEHELEDVENYLTMAENAEKMGKNELATGLYEIAKDEYTHADFIADQMKENGTAATPESWEKFMQLTEKMKPFF